MKATLAQIKRLQTCYGQLCTHSIGFENTREARLAWAAEVLGRQIASFSQLTLDQARTLIDAAQGALGHRDPLKPGAKRQQEPKRSAEAAHRAGVDGRAGETVYAASPEIVSAEDIETIASYYARLGWDLSQFDKWIHSRSSPLRGRKQVRTTADANRVRWALKGMLQDAGRWADWNAA